MKKIGIIIASLLIYSISYAGYVTIEKEKIIIGDNAKVIDKLPIGERVEVISETKNGYIIKYDGEIAEINKECLRLSKDEQPSVIPYGGILQKVYEVSLELNKGEEYKVINEGKTKYLVEYPLKNTVAKIWIEKNLVSYKEYSKLEEEQIAKGLVKYKEDEWITPEEFNKREKEIRELQTTRFNIHRKLIDNNIATLERFRNDSFKLSKNKILQKYDTDFELRTLISIDTEIQYCLMYLAQKGEDKSKEYHALMEINNKNKKELEQWAKTATPEKADNKNKKELEQFIKTQKEQSEQYINAGIEKIKKEGFEQWAKTLTPKQPQFIFVEDLSFTMGAEEKKIKIQKSEYKTHIKLFDKYMLSFERFRDDSSKLSKNELLQKYGDDFEFKTLIAIDNEFKYCLECIKQDGVITEEYSFLIKIGKEYKKELEQWAKVEPHTIPHGKKIPQEPSIMEKESEICQEPPTIINATVEKLKDSTARYVGQHLVLDKIFIDGIPEKVEQSYRLGIQSPNGLYITPYDTYDKGLCFSIKNNIVKNFISEQEPDNFYRARITCEIKAVREKGETKYYSGEIYKIEVYNMDESIKRTYQ